MSKQLSTETIYAGLYVLPRGTLGTSYTGVRASLMTLSIYAPFALNEVSLTVEPDERKGASG
jgi:hypothetical protein